VRGRKGDHPCSFAPCSPAQKMKIIVPLKQILSPAGLTINRKAGKVFVNKEEYVLNPASKRALEAALRIKDSAGADVIAITFGPARAEDCLREARALGADRAIFVGKTKTFRLYRVGAAAAGLARDRIEHARNAHDVIAMLRDELEPTDVVLTSGRWQHALGRVGLALAGRDVQCRADPCPFKRMLCDVCPFLEQEFYGLPAAATEAEPS